MEWWRALGGLGESRGGGAGVCEGVAGVERELESVACE